MKEPHRSSLRRDFRIFLDPGFLVTVALVTALAAAGAAVLVASSEMYGIPLSGNWR